MLNVAFFIVMLNVVMVNAIMPNVIETLERLRAYQSGAPTPH
jgi:hypothetical protein